jgi:5-(carboxyamino)imidazole ribonucleotide mutase
LHDEPLVGILMGSRNDWPVMEKAAEILRHFQVPYEARVVSAHRTPNYLYAYAEEAAPRGLQVIIAGAGGAAHLPGMIASMTLLPVLGVPIPSKALQGIDSLLSIVQMPAGIPVPTLAIGEAGATNAALTAVSIIGLEHPDLQELLAQYREAQSDAVFDAGDPEDPPNRG